MESDPKINKMTITELKETLRRIEEILSSSSLMEKLKDKGEKMKRTKAKVEKEIQFRETLEQTEEKMCNLSLASSSRLPSNKLYAEKLCSVEKITMTTRFIPALSLKGATESIPKSTKLIDLSKSLQLQSEQKERVEIEQVKSKQFRLIALQDEETDED